MLEIAESLGDDRVNVVPDLPGGNSAYQLVFHCCGMLEWWTRESILGQPVGRDRAAEFTATGTVAQRLGDLEHRREMPLDQEEMVHVSPLASSAARCPGPSLVTA